MLPVNTDRNIRRSNFHIQWDPTDWAILGTIMTTCRIHVGWLAAVSLAACAGHSSQPAMRSTMAPASKPAPADAMRGYRNVPANYFDGVPVDCAAPHLPDATAHASAGKEVTGIYKVCVGTDGHVSGVAVLESIPGADQEIIRMISLCTYRPPQIPVCSINRLVFNVPPATRAAPPSTP